MTCTINHSWGCCAEESKGIFLEEAWEWDKLARPTDRLEPLIEEPAEESGTAGWAGPPAAEADAGRAVMDWDPHLTSSTRVGATTGLTQNLEWVRLARVMPLWWAEWRGSCTKTLYNGHKTITRHRLVKAKWRWEIKPSFWNLLASLWWSS